MTTVGLHIVALPYYEVGECLGEFFAEAQGRAMTLRPDPTNDVDVNAICAYDWQGRHVGYVAIHDQLSAWQTLRGSGRRSLRGRVCEVNAEHKCVVFECRVETMGSVEDLYPQTSYLKWTYTGPVMKATQKTVTLDYMMDEISERLDERDSWDEADSENFVVLCKRFSDLSKYDLSGEMSDYRRRLCLRLLETKDDLLKPLVEELNMAYGRAGRESQGGDVLDYWMHLLSAPKNIKSLLVHRHEYDLGKVQEQLQEFPEAMYEEWLENREHFVTKLLYMHIPREVLWRFISGIAFCEAVKPRVQVQKDEQETIADRILQLPTVELQYEAYQQINTLLTGTSWSEKAAEVLEKMFAKVKEQQDRQEQKQDKILDSMEKAANKKTNEFKVYPQAGSTANVGCQMQSPEFKVIPPSEEQQPALESNKEGDEDV